MRAFWGVVLGLLFFFPGIEILRWLARALGLYQSMTVQEGALVIIMILLTVIALHLRALRPAAESHERRAALRRAAGPTPRSYDSSTRHPEQRRRFPRD